MTTIYVNVGNPGLSPGNPWDYNEINAGSTSTGTLKADLLDDLGASTGIGLDQIVAFGGAGGTSATATSGAGGWPEGVFDSFWYFTSGTPKHRLTGLTNGASYTIEVAAHQNVPAGRDTDVTIGGTTELYAVSGTANPAPPITISGTISGTTLDIDFALVSTAGYLNGYKITITPPPSYTITSIDGDNDVQAGQSNVSIVTSGIDPASVTQAVTLGGETLTINSWADSGGNALINVDITADINLEWGTTHELAVTHDGGTTTLSGVTLSAPTGWETVSFATIPDTGTTESFYEYSQSDVTVGNFTAQVGDTLAFTSSTGLTIDGSSIPVVDPAATVTGSYKWWDASLSTWTPVSSYTITNLGVFGGGDTTVMIQEMISDMISEMVN